MRLQGGGVLVSDHALLTPDRRTCLTGQSNQFRLPGFSPRASGSFVPVSAKHVPPGFPSPPNAVLTLGTQPTAGRFEGSSHPLRAVAAVATLPSAPHKNTRCQLTKVVNSASAPLLQLASAHTRTVRTDAAYRYRRCIESGPNRVLSVSMCDVNVDDRRCLQVPAGRWRFADAVWC